jgi:hypothetical protein
MLHTCHVTPLGNAHTANVASVCKCSMSAYLKDVKYIRSSAGSSNYNRYNKQSIEILKEREQLTEIDNNRLIKSGKKGVKFAVNKKFIGIQKMTLKIPEITVIEQI